jgi:glycosyltransferase involved in cell wall biosynthesis
LNFSDITFVILTKNEAARIERCLRSIPDGCSMLVYDSQSGDGTADLARGMGATVVDAPWRGFAQTRLDAAALVKTPWTFMLDADEVVTSELSVELTSLDPPDGVAAYSVPRRNYFCGRWVRGAGWWPDRLVRLFRTGHAGITSRHGGEASLHEMWQPDGAIAQLASPLEHRSYDSLADYRAKFTRYTDIEASGARADPLAVVSESSLFPLRVLWLLFGRGAVLDGWRGAYIAWCSALYPLVVAAKAARGAQPASSG